ncbi:MAG: hypothetical protein MUE94_10390 [Verrucomicrobia bacterium]|jgi:hypothetical protein|nr:hypothetical protein [Verrucomicrobiota bacterium]
MKLPVVPVVLLSLGGAFLFECHSIAQVQFDLDLVFSGTNTPPASAAAPWVTATLDDVAPNQVLFTLEATGNLTGQENVRQFYFNFDDSLDLGALGFTFLGSSGLFTPPAWTLSENNLKADGDGKYDVRLDFATGGNTSDTFNRNESVSYLLTYSGAGSITRESFIYESQPAGGHGPFYTAAHVQNTLAGGSAWLGAETITYIPEPNSASLLALTALGWLALRPRTASRQER